MPRQLAALRYAASPPIRLLLCGFTCAETLLQLPFWKAANVLPASLQGLYQEFQRATEQLMQDSLQEQRVGIGFNTKLWHPCPKIGC